MVGSGLGAGRRGEEEDVVVSVVALSASPQKVNQGGAKAPKMTAWLYLPPPIRAGADAHPPNTPRPCRATRVRVGTRAHF